YLSTRPVRQKGVRRVSEAKGVDGDAMTGGPSPRPSPAGRGSRCRNRSSGKGGRCGWRSPGAGGEGANWGPGGGGTPSVSLECSSRVERANTSASSADPWVVEPRVGITGSDQRSRQAEILSRKPGKEIGYFSNPAFGQPARCAKASQKKRATMTAPR